MPLALLDLNDTIIGSYRRDGFVLDDQDFFPLDGAMDALRLWRDEGWKVAVVTNQSGHHRFPDRVTEEQMVTLMDHIKGGLWAQTGQDVPFYVCYHDGQDCDHCGGKGFTMCADSFDQETYKCMTCGGFGSVGCDCRKPRPGLIKQALLDHECDPTDAVMIGDKWSDIMAGDLASVPGILIGTFGYENRGRSQMPKDVPDPRLWVPDLWQAAVVTVARHRMGSPL